MLQLEYAIENFGISTCCFSGANVSNLPYLNTYAIKFYVYLLYQKQLDHSFWSPFLLCANDLTTIDHN